MKHNHNKIGTIYKSLVISNAHSKFKNKSKFNYEYYYDMIYLVLNNINSWRSLEHTKCEAHYTTIFKVYKKWSNEHIFRDSYYQLLELFGYNINNLFKYNTDLFIDSMTVFNKSGSEHISKIPMYMKKKGTKIHIIGTKDKIPLIIFHSKPSVHDTRFIVKGLEEIISKFNITNHINLIGDKLYIQDFNIKKSLKEIFNTKLITPKRKNQHNLKLTKTDKDKLKQRYTIEHINKIIAQFDRLHFRKDKPITSYSEFCFMACGIHFENNFIK